jgi:hypothetical protein
MDVPNLKIKMKGGLFKIKTTIINEGVCEADDINWEISLDGGLILLGRNSGGSVSNIAAGEEVIVESDLILGLGEVTVYFTASGPECFKTCDRGGKVILAYVHVNAGGE